MATDLNAEKLGELKKEVPALVTDTLDVTSRESVEQLLREKYSDTNVLFNCAGYKQYTPSEQLACFSVLGMCSRGLYWRRMRKCGTSPLTLT